MISRRALLVASPEIPNDGLPGARQDVQNFENYLLSIEGGAWDPNEVTKLFNPSKADLLRSVRALSTADYAFITFSGHGSHHVGKELNDTSLKLTQIESCYVYEVNPQNRRHFLVVDACRAVVRISEAIRPSQFAIANAARPEISRQQARALFEESFGAADEGRVVAYSCKVGQAAGESPSGGFFSKALVDESTRWSNNAKANEVLSVKDAFNTAQLETYTRNAPQRAELQAGRRLRHFPFAVSVTPHRLYG